MAKYGKHPEVSQFLKDENNRLIRDFEKKLNDNKIREMYRKDALEARQALTCKSKSIEIRYRDNHQHD